MALPRSDSANLIGAFRRSRALGIGKDACLQNVVVRDGCHCRPRSHGPTRQSSRDLAVQNALGATREVLELAAITICASRDHQALQAGHVASILARRS